MEMLAILLLGAAIGWLVAQVRQLRAGMIVPDDAPATSTAPEPPVAKDTSAREPEPVDARTQVTAIARELVDAGDQFEHPAEFAADPRFVALRDLLAQPPFDAQERLNRALSQNTALSGAAIAAMTVAGDDRRTELANLAGGMGSFALWFALLHLREGDDPAACGLLLHSASDWWCEQPATRAALVSYLDRQQERGVVPVLPADANLGHVDVEYRRNALRGAAHPLVEAYLQALELAMRGRRGERELAEVARPLAGDDDAPLARSAGFDARVEQVRQMLARPGRPSVVLVGPGGAGKTTLARATLRALASDGWRVVEASPAQLMAGQKYIGQIEQRVQHFVDGLAAGRTVWFVPDIHHLLEQGTWEGNPHGLLDLLLPHLERGALQLLGESSVAAWSRVLTKRPRADAVITGMRVEPLDDAEALTLARDWARQWRERLGAEVLPEAIAVEAATLARQQFPDRAEPGRTLQLLAEALAEARRTDPPALPLDRDQLLEALARSSGLPLDILDTRRALDVAAVRDYFATRVLGQDEAVDCLVDRIVMLKAGLTDPRRPIGVFLFAGPTGTGKTEIAKTLASYLFGSPDRMLRIDMSEYQTDDSAWRLIDDGRDGGSTSLATRIRQAPFSVVLLDEFEKASPRIWDLFLQVFDDGRLTDRGGNTADFRHSIIVLTSNLGAAIARGGGVGFVAQAGGFSRELVDRAIAQTFRREFVNRLDRVVVFNPLTRARMRDLLGKELRDVLGRRGFRGRDWAVEWEPSAVEFLLDRGFTPDLGARPLRRAIDQHLLAPLARTIVEHKVPSGEQFLFVQADGDGLRVRFVDPDAPTAGVVAPAGAAPADLRALALDPRADAAALDVLGRSLVALAGRRDDVEWTGLKDAAAQAMQAPGFWQQSARVEVLDRLERMDRIEAGLRSAEALHARLDRSAGRGATDLVRRLARLAAALGAAMDAVLADEPEDARIELRPTDPRAAGALAWRDRLVRMYQAWANARGVRVQAHAPDAIGSVRLDLAGFAAWQTLREEAGLHVLETARGEDTERHAVRVTVQPDPAPPTTAAPAADADTRVCRRYDDGPAPLVRDTVRGWRTGRLDRVLAGDFDLVGGESTKESAR